LTIVNILTVLPNLMDSPIYIKLNSLYEAVVKTTSTGIRQSTRLSSLLQWQQETDPRKKQKLELAIDEMRNVFVGGVYKYIQGRSCIYNSAACNGHSIISITLWPQSLGDLCSVS